MIKSGDKVEVGGVVASIESVLAQGKHTHYKLDDGRVVLDLEALVKSGHAKLITQSRLRFDPKKLIAEDQ